MDLPAGTPRAAVVFAHPLPTQGGTMHTKVVFQAAKALTRIGCAVLRFNFRGVGRSAGTWDEGRGFAEIRRRWLERAAGVGAPLAINVAGAVRRGIFETIDDEGRLVIRAADGSIDASAKRASTVAAWYGV